MFISSAEIYCRAEQQIQEAPKVHYIDPGIDLEVASRFKPASDIVILQYMYTVAA